MSTQEPISPMSTVSTMDPDGTNIETTDDDDERTDSSVLRILPVINIAIFITIATYIF